MMARPIDKIDSLSSKTLGMKYFRLKDHRELMIDDDCSASTCWTFLRHFEILRHHHHRRLLVHPFLLLSILLMCNLHRFCVSIEANVQHVHWLLFLVFYQAENQLVVYDSKVYDFIIMCAQVLPVDQGKIIAWSNHSIQLIDLMTRKKDKVESRRSKITDKLAFVTIHLDLFRVHLFSSFDRLQIVNVREKTSSHRQGFLLRE